MLKMSSTSIPLTDVESDYTAAIRPLHKFLKGEPKALGVVQIMIGLLTIVFGIGLTVYLQSISVNSGFMFLCSPIYIIAGSLAVSASNKLNTCMVTSALIMNCIGTIVSGTEIIILSLDLHSGSNTDKTESLIRGISGVLLVFSLLQFAVSLTVSVFAYKATYTGLRTLNAVAFSTRPLEYPPAYTEKSQPDN